MCIVFLAHGVTADADLVILANRDEFRNRPTEAMHLWRDSPFILAGRDQQSGGTWMGFGKDNSVALVTNYRDLRFKDFVGPSRGGLVTRFFQLGADVEHFAQWLQAHGSSYAGFNIIYGRPGELFFFSNVEQVVRPIEQGIHGLSNAFLDTAWPKVEKGKGLLQDALAIDDRPSEDRLFEILADQAHPPDETLPHTGVGLDWERFLSPIFINGTTYGSRCSTVAIWRKGQLDVALERSFNGGPEDYTMRRFCEV